MSTTITRKQQIRTVAQEMFRKQGYAATGMRELAKEVGIEPASLYNHIRSKEEILHDICFNMADAFFIELESVPVYDAPAKRLEKAILGHLKVVVEHLDASSVFFSEWRHLSEPDLGRFKSMRSNYEWKFKEIIQDGINSGTFRKVDLRTTTFTIFSALNAVYDLYKSQNDQSIDTIAKSISTLIIEGIKK